MSVFIIFMNITPQDHLFICYFSVFLSSCALTTVRPLHNIPTSLSTCTFTIVTTQYSVLTTPSSYTYHYRHTDYLIILYFLHHHCTSLCSHHLIHPQHYLPPLLIHSYSVFTTPQTDLYHYYIPSSPTFPCLVCHNSIFLQCPHQSIT